MLIYGCLFVSVACAHTHTHNVNVTQNSEISESEINEMNSTRNVSHRPEACNKRNINIQNFLTFYSLFFVVFAVTMHSALILAGIVN